MPLRPLEDDDEDEHADRMTANLVAAIVCLLILGAGLFLVESMHRSQKIQECVEAGRRNCSTAPLR